MEYLTNIFNNLPSINCYNDGNSWGGLVTKNYYQKSENVTVFWFGTFHSWYGGNQAVWSHSSDADTLGPPHNDIGMRYSGNNKIKYANINTRQVTTFLDNFYNLSAV